MRVVWLVESLLLSRLVLLNTLLALDAAVFPHPVVPKGISKVEVMFCKIPDCARLIASLSLDLIALYKFTAKRFVQSAPCNHTLLNCW